MVVHNQKQDENAGVSRVPFRVADEAGSMAKFALQILTSDRVLFRLF